MIDSFYLDPAEYPASYIEEIEANEKLALLRREASARMPVTRGELIEVLLLLKNSSPMQVVRTIAIKWNLQ